MGNTSTRITFGVTGLLMIAYAITTLTISPAVQNAISSNLSSAFYDAKLDLILNTMLIGCGAYFVHSSILRKSVAGESLVAKLHAWIVAPAFFVVLAVDLFRIFH